MLQKGYYIPVEFILIAELKKKIRIFNQDNVVRRILWFWIKNCSDIFWLLRILQCGAFINISYHIQIYPLTLDQPVEHLFIHNILLFLESWASSNCNLHSMSMHSCTYQKLKFRFPIFVLRKISISFSLVCQWLCYY